MQSGLQLDLNLEKSRIKEEVRQGMLVLLIKKMVGVRYRRAWLHSLNVLALIDTIPPLPQHTHTHTHTLTHSLSQATTMDQKVKDANNRIAFEVFQTNYYRGQKAIIEGLHIIYPGCPASYSDGVSEGRVDQVPCGRHLLHSNHHSLADIWPIKTHEISRPATMSSKIISNTPFPPQVYFYCYDNVSQTNAVFIDTKSDTLLSSFYPNNILIIVLKV